MGKRMLQDGLAGQRECKRTRETAFTTHQSNLMGTPIRPDDGFLGGRPMMGTPYGCLDRPMMSTPLPAPEERMTDLYISLPFTPVNRDEGEELNHGDNRANAGQSTGAGEGDLWVYDEELLGDREFPSGLQVVPKIFNDMKMFSVLFVKFRCPSIKQNRCIEAVQEGYRVLVENWLERNQEHDATVLDCADKLRRFADTTVRRRVNRLLKTASRWPITKNRVFSYRTFETPRRGRIYESQETLNCLKAAIIKNAKEHHEKHKAKAPPSCKSLLDAVRPDKVAEVVIQDVLTTNEVFSDLLSVPESMEDVSPEQVDEVQRTLEFSLHDDQCVFQPEDWHDAFPSIECDMHHEDILCVDLQEFGPWDLGQWLR
mmetsp:Transcript_3453/g.7000  ORF Transcript_3453/g.7000 Transcript_3453/m.7000 type:complete len:371 (-) Transcript_3453:134-1246(-)